MIRRLGCGLQSLRCISNKVCKGNPTISLRTSNRSSRNANIEAKTQKASLAIEEPGNLNKSHQFCDSSPLFKDLDSWSLEDLDLFYKTVKTREQWKIYGFYSEYPEERFEFGGDTLGYKTIFMCKPLKIKKPSYANLRLEDIISGKLAGTIYFSAFMADKVDAVAYFARYSALNMKIKITPVMSLPTELKRWKINKSTFAFAKKKEEFERRIYTRAIQMYDSPLPAIKYLVKYVKEALPNAVDMKVVTYVYENMSTLDMMYKKLIKTNSRFKGCVQSRKEPFELAVDKKINEYLKEWNSQ